MILDHGASVTDTQLQIAKDAAQVILRAIDEHDKVIIIPVSLWGMKAVLNISNTYFCFIIFSQRHHSDISVTSGPDGTSVSIPLSCSPSVVTFPSPKTFSLTSSLKMHRDHTTPYAGLQYENQDGQLLPSFFPA